MTTPISLKAPSASIAALPADKTLQKRPLAHDPIPTPISTAPKVVYISAKTPFISAVKRVESYLDAAEKSTRSKKQKITSVEKENQNAGVTLKATGKAVDRCLQIACFFMGKGYEVRLKTGSLEVVDDVVELGIGEIRKQKAPKGRAGDIQVEEDQDLEMVKRTTSVLEVLVYRRKEKSS
ncbi:Rpp20 subunit of nuclear RNase MRP and P-domain-containing protein [Pyronema omphalodes]|nr:Rpp20 subunit of nuclear RNase MRP and P-domain-containing protein [Pyronema omphalodes]